MKKTSFYRTFVHKALKGSVLVLPLLFSACMESPYPEDETMSEEQVNNSPSAIRGLANAIPVKFATAGTYDTSNYFDTGYSGLALVRDVIGEDMAVASGSDYYYYWGGDSYIGGNYATTKYPWNWYYSAIAKCHILLRRAASKNDDTRQYFGAAHFYRALCYFDLARMYEYRPTGNKELDGDAQQRDIYQLTVPLIDENSTEESMRNTPRLPWAQMYLFILSDLEAAEADITGTSRNAKNLPDMACVYGQKARVYLDMATRFRLYPDQLTAYVQAAQAAGKTVPTDGASYYKTAIDCAQEAISGGYNPLTESDWYGGGMTGFNTVSKPSWMLGVIVDKQNITNGGYLTSIGNLAPEQTYGFAGFSVSNGVYTNMYKCQRTINRRLFESITPGDWRKTTWIAPEDAGKANSGKYVTVAPEAMFKEFPEYTGLKFRPVNGNMTDYSIGCAADYPLMRVEEMFFIKMEAELYYSGIAEAQSTLEAFMAHRMAAGQTYVCSATGSKEKMLTEILLQKRVEFWGEGVTYFDYKRLNLRVTRHYDGSNYPTNYQYNSEGGQNDNYVPCTFNFYIPDTELSKNAAMTQKGNPDPSNRANFK